jgi:hypothetical protein
MRWLCLGVVQLLSCSFDARTAVGAEVVCVSDAECPPTTKCALGISRCREAPTQPPRIRMAELTPARAAPGALVEATVDIDGSLGTSLELALTLPSGITLPMELSGAKPYRGRVVLPQTVSSGVARLATQGSDAFGTPLAVGPRAQLTIDADAPRPQSARLRLVAPGASLAVSRLGPAGQGQLSVVFDEDPVSTQWRADPPLIDFSVDEASQFTVLRLVADAGQLEAPVSLWVDAVDALGNRAESRLPVELMVDSLPSSVDEVVFERAPFGDAREPLSWAEVRAMVPQGTTLRVRDASGNELGRRRSADGGVAVRLVGAAEAALVIDAIDEAGNVSQAASPTRKIVTLVPRATGQPGSPVVRTTSAASDFIDRRLPSLVTGNVAIADDEQAIEVLGGASFRGLTSAPAPNGVRSIASDELGSGVLLLNGFDMRWWRRGRFVTPGLAEIANMSAPMALDRARDVFVRATLAAGEVEEFDGLSWSRRLAVPAPSPRADPALVTNPTGGVILIGGLGSGQVAETDAWLYRDGAWARLDAGTMPLGLVRGAFDPVAQRAMFVSRAADGGTGMWSFDGRAFVSVGQGGPGIENSASLAWSADGGGGWLVTSDGRADAWHWRQATGWQRLGALGLFYSGVVATVSGEGQPALFLGDEVRAFRVPSGAAVSFPERPGFRTGVLLGVDGERVLMGGGSEGLGLAYPTLYQWAPGAGFSVLGNTLFRSGRDNSTAWSVADGASMVYGAGCRSAVSTGIRCPEVTVARTNASGTTQIASSSRRAGISDTWLVPWVHQGQIYALDDERFWRLGPTQWEAVAGHDAGVRRGATVLPLDSNRVLVVGGGPNGPNGENAVVSEVGLDVVFDGGMPVARPMALPSALRRFQAAAGLDPERNTWWVYGGRLDDRAELGDLLEVRLDGGLSSISWPTDDAEGDGEPVASHGGRLFWSPTLRRPLLVGAERVTSQGTYDIVGSLRDSTEVWALERASNRPAVEVSLPLPVELLGRLDVAELRWAIIGTGRGLKNGLPTGPIVEVWRGGRWERLAGLSGTWRGPLHQVVSSGSRLRMRLTVDGSNEAGQASVELDAMQVSLEYAP